MSWALTLWGGACIECWLYWVLPIGPTLFGTASIGYWHYWALPIGLSPGSPFISNAVHAEAKLLELGAVLEGLSKPGVHRIPKGKPMGHPKKPIAKPIGSQET